MAGYFISMAVNPKPVVDAGNDAAARNWAALNTSGLILVSHGLKVPHDTPDQPPRPWSSGGASTEGTAPGSWASPRFGRYSYTVNAYEPDVAHGLIVYDWTPDDLKGYVHDAYGALWPFGSDTPMAATGLNGAPFGSEQLNPNATGVPWTNGFQMHSANGLPLGLGGWPDGFGWMISLEGIIVDWGGPVAPLQSPPNTAVGGVVGTGLNIVRDFKVNPNNSGQFYVLWENGWVSWGGLQPANANAVPVTSSQPAVNNTTTTTTFPGARWMHVQWDEGWIIAMNRKGQLWGYLLAESSPPGNLKPFPPVGSVADAWYNPADNITTAYGPLGIWQSGDIVPAHSPTRFYILDYAGRAISPAVTGVIQTLNPTVAGATTTTQPTVNWTYNELAGATSVGSQKGYSIRVYTQQYITDQGLAFVPGQNAGAVEQHDAITATASHHITRNLRNGIAFRAYVRVTSSAGVVTAWENVNFTMAIPLPTTPSSCVATPVPGTWPTTLGTVSIAAGGGAPPSGEYLQYQVSANNSPFIDVFQASATTLTTVVDPFPFTNVSLVYRVRRFKRVPAKIPSAWRTASPVTVSPPGGAPSAYFFIDPGPAGAGPIVILPLEVADVGYVASASFEAQDPRGEFQPLTQPAKIITSAGVKGDDHSLTLKVMNTAQYNSVRTMLSLTRPIIYMNGFGRSWWVRPTPGTWKTLQLGAIPGETSGIRDAHDVSLRLVNSVPPR